MKNLFLFIFIFHFSYLIAQEQKIQVNPTSNQVLDADVYVGFDGIGYLYYIKNNVLYKKHNEELWHYKNISLGEITKIDIQNPLKIVLFYENFNTIITLDNQLNETQKINFSQNEFSILVAATGIASQNRLWIYNSLTQQIGLFDYLKNTYKSITTSFAGNVKYYESDFNTFQWIDDKMNWYSCDIFGKVTTLGTVPNFDQIQITSSSTLFYTKNNVLYYRNIIENKDSIIDLDKKTFTFFYNKDQILSIFTNQEITNYKITTP